MRMHLKSLLDLPDDDDTDDDDTDDDDTDDDDTDDEPLLEGDDDDDGDDKAFLVELQKLVAQAEVLAAT